MEIPRSKEELQQIRNMDVESLSRLVFRMVKQRLREQGTLPDNSCTSLGLRDSLFPDTNPIQSSYDRVKLLEAIVLLERRGLVVKDDSYSWMRDRHVGEFAIHLTSIGMKSKCDEILLLVDNPEQIVGALEQEIGTLDNTVRQYYLESLRAYQEGLYISSVICLGAATERAIHWLAEGIESYSEKYQKGIESKRNRSIFQLTKYLSGNVIHNIFEDNKELKDRLDGLAGVYCENRIEAGHPKNVMQNWSREDQEILLLQFCRYITTICKAILECHAKGESTASGH